MKLDQNRLLRIVGIGGVLFIVFLLFGILPKSQEYLQVFTPERIAAIILILAVIELFVAAMQRESFGHIIVWVTVVLATMIPVFAGWSMINALCLAAIAVTWIIMEGIKSRTRTKV